MNGTVVDISGITVSTLTIDCEDTTDKAHIITIKDEYGSEISVTITYGKITGNTWQKK